MKDCKGNEFDVGSILELDGKPIIKCVSIEDGVAELEYLDADVNRFNISQKSMLATKWLAPASPSKAVDPMERREAPEELRKKLNLVQSKLRQ